MTSVLNPDPPSLTNDLLDLNVFDTFILSVKSMITFHDDVT